MKRYETVVIVDPDLSEEGRVPVFERIQEIIPQQGGALIEVDDWGAKRLAYEIKKKKRGFYSRIDYCGTGAVVDEMERFFRIDDRVMKYLTVVLAEEADPEALLAEKQAKAEAAKVAATPAPPVESTDEAPTSDKTAETAAANEAAESAAANEAAESAAADEAAETPAADEAGETAAADAAAEPAPEAETKEATPSTDSKEEA